MRLDPQIAHGLELDHWFVEAWALALGEAASTHDPGNGAGALEVRAEAAAPEHWATWNEPLWRRLAWATGGGAQIWVGCPTPVAEALCAHVRGGKAPDSAEQSIETFHEMLNRCVSYVESEASSRLGKTMETSAPEPSEPPETGWAVELHFEVGGESQTIAIVGNEAMAMAVSPPVAQEPGADASPPPEPHASTEARPDPLELIREVSMELAVSFGDTSLPLADVLKLASGAIIELNRSVTDPVEVLVNGSVIARGDVVVVDGNYGVRITEIVSRRERVRSMM